MPITNHLVAQVALDMIRGSGSIEAEALREEAVDKVRFVGIEHDVELTSDSTIHLDNAIPQLAMIPG